MQKLTNLLLFYCIILTTLASAQNNQNCISESKKLAISKEVIKNIDGLKNKGLLPSTKSPKMKLIWPLRQSEGFTDPNYYATINYVDQDPTPGIQDYNCGQRTFDGHRGTDIMLWPYRWDKMVKKQVEVIAAAKGRIVFKQDGFSDQNCNCENFDFNGVVILNDDGAVVYYVHLSKNSVTQKKVGESVEVGEYLGVVGSSGCSTDPHLHFEVYSDQTQTELVDPYAGLCNRMNGDSSSWENQKPYRETRINKLMTHYSEPIQRWECPANNDEIKESNEFVVGTDGGTKIYLSANYQDKLVDHMTTLNIKMPNGEVWQSWDYISKTTFNASWETWEFTLPSSAPAGTWTFSATFMGVIYEHTFEVTSITSPTINLGRAEVKVFPNPFINELYIESTGPTSENIQVIIYDSNLNQIANKNQITNGKLSTATESWGRGIYFIQIINGEFQKIEKIVRL